MSALRLALACAGTLLALASSGHAHAITPAQLQQQGHLSVASELLPADDIVTGQRASLVLEVATDRWFAGGTRIGIPEVNGLVILQTEQFAANASEMRDGQSWVIQRWTLDVYPTRAGSYKVGPIKLTVNVNHEEAGVVSGSLQSPPVSFKVIDPPAWQRTSSGWFHPTTACSRASTGNSNRWW